MGKAVNQTILLGRLTSDVELKTTPSGKKVAEFTLAVDKGNDQANFFNVVSWEKTAELVAQYTNKGSKVLVQGRLDQQTWEKEGKKNSKVVVIAFDVTFLDPKGESSKPKDTVIEDFDDSKPLDLSEIPF